MLTTEYEIWGGGGGGEDVQNKNFVTDDEVW